MSSMQQYKCPSCGGAVEFNTTSQNLKCPYCESEFNIETLQAQNQMADALNADDKMDGWNTSAGAEWTAEDDTGVVTYICQSCGGEVLGDENLGATECPFCGNNIVFKDKFSNGLKPDLVIPFKLDKKAAKEALKKHLTGKKLLPKVFSTENHIDEIKGIYVPFWLFDAKVEGKVKYSATRVNMWKAGDYQYTQTNFYDVYREGSIAFENIPVDASSKMANDLMDSLEPFHFDEAVDFNTAYFAGYLADKYDETVETNLPRINKRVKRSTEDAFLSTVNAGYATISTDSSVIDLKDGNAKYVLLPVWLLNTTWKGEKYVFAMNGQTGKFVGNLPMDKRLLRKYWLLSFLVSGFAGALLGLITMLITK